MLVPASPISPYYGFGWYLDPDNDTAWHSGSSPGFETLLTIRPDGTDSTDGDGVVVLVNAGSGMGFGETADLRTGITARALGLDDEGQGSRWPQKTVFLGLVLLPVVYVLSMVWAWRHRTEIRAKSGAFGRFSWWFPLVTTLVSVWALALVLSVSAHRGPVLGSDGFA